MATTNNNSSPKPDNQNVRPASQAQDAQTEYTDQYPPLDDPRALKQARTTEKARATRLANKIGKHIHDKGSRTELKYMKKDFSNIIDDCFSIQQQYCNAKGEEDNRDKQWTEEIFLNSKRIHQMIEDYLARPSRPASAASVDQASHRSVDSQSNASIHSQQPNRPSSRLSASPSPSSSISAQFSKALEEEKSRSEKLEQQIQQMKIDEKAKIKKAVEEERDRQSSRYTTANQEAVDEAEKRLKEVAEENKKLKTVLEIKKQKQKELFQATQEKDRLLKQEQRERRENEKILNQKIHQKNSKPIQKHRSSPCCLHSSILTLSVKTQQQLTKKPLATKETDQSTLKSGRPTTKT